MTALGEAHRAAGELESSKATLREALGIARRLAAEDPQAHAPKLYKLLDSMGWTLEENEEFEQAEAMYREAIRTAREMTAGSDKAFRPRAPRCRIGRAVHEDRAHRPRRTVDPRSVGHT